MRLPTSNGMNKDMNTHETQTERQEKADQELATLVLGKIQEEKIRPTQKKYFTLREMSLWTPGILVTIIGAFAWAGIIFNTTHSSFKYREFIRPGSVPFIIRELPTIWVIAFLFFALLVIKAFRQTKHGYKYNASTVLYMSIVVSFVLGLIIVQSDVYYKNPLLRFPTERIQKGIWSNPNEGRLTGVITRSPDGTVFLTDTRGKMWVLNTQEIPIMEDMFTDSTFVRMVGRVEGDRTFIVCMVAQGKIERESQKFLKPPPPKASQTCDKILTELREHFHR